MITAEMADGSTYEIKTLLGKGDSNVKLAKSDKAGKGYLTVGLSLAPANVSGYEVCASRSPGCTKDCLYLAGMGQVHAVQTARIAKTRLFFQKRELFLSMLEVELEAAVKRAKKQDKTLACRLNVLSDLQWEKLFPGLFKLFPNVQFYDYTKHAIRMMKYLEGKNWPSNYHLTFSRSEDNDHETRQVLAYGGNVAVVFFDVPKNYGPYEVINGDETDLRFLDKKNVVVGLKAKGKARKDTSGFVIARRIPLAMA